MLDAEAAQDRGVLAARGNQAEDAVRWLRRSIALLREMDAPIQLARGQVQLAELLSGVGNADDVGTLAAEAASSFRAPGAIPWLERATTLGRVEAL